MRCQQATHARLAQVLLEDDGTRLAPLDKLVRVERLKQQEEARGVRPAERLDQVAAQVALHDRRAKRAGRASDARGDGRRRAECVTRAAILSRGVPPAAVAIAGEPGEALRHALPTGAVQACRALSAGLAKTARTCFILVLRWQSSGEMAFLQLIWPSDSIVAVEELSHCGEQVDWPTRRELLDV